MDIEQAVELSEISLTLKGPSGKINVLRDVGFTLKRGESVSLVGPSGAGKTSLLMVIAGLQSVTRGRVKVYGRDITDLNEDALALFRRDHIGIVFQGFHLLPTMTALENVAVPLELAGIEDAFERSGEMLGRVGLGKRLDHYPGQLSGGEQQRVALARAFAARPKVLLADEPTGNLDQENGARVMKLMHALRDEYGASLLLITHEKKLADSCDRALTIEDGRLRA